MPLDQWLNGYWAQWLVWRIKTRQSFVLCVLAQEWGDQVNTQNQLVSARKTLTLLLMHRSYIFLALTHRNDVGSFDLDSKKTSCPILHTSLCLLMAKCSSMHSYDQLVVTYVYIPIKGPTGGGEGVMMKCMSLKESCISIHILLKLTKYIISDGWTMAQCSLVLL